MPLPSKSSNPEGIILIIPPKLPSQSSNPEGIILIIPPKLPSKSSNPEGIILIIHAEGIHPNHPWRSHSSLFTSFPSVIFLEVIELLKSVPLGSFEHIDELGQFVEAGLSQKLTDPVAPLLTRFQIVCKLKMAYLVNMTGRDKRA